MMRQSVASSRASHLPPQPANAAATARLVEKKKEYEAVAALERASATFLKRIEGLADDCDIMAEAGIVHGQVLAQWPQMFRILNMFLSKREQPMDEQQDESAAALPIGDRLVRVPVDELQAPGPQRPS